MLVLWRNSWLWQLLRGQSVVAVVPYKILIIQTRVVEGMRLVERYRLMIHHWTDRGLGGQSGWLVKLCEGVIRRIIVQKPVHILSWFIVIGRSRRRRCRRRCRISGRIWGCQSRSKATTLIGRGVGKRRTCRISFDATRALKGLALLGLLVARAAILEPDWNALNAQIQHGGEIVHAANFGIVRLLKCSLQDIKLEMGREMRFNSNSNNDLLFK